MGKFWVFFQALKKKNKLLRRHVARQVLRHVTHSCKEKLHRLTPALFMFPSERDISGTQKFTNYFCAALRVKFQLSTQVLRNKKEDLLPN